MTYTDAIKDVTLIKVVQLDPYSSTVVLYIVDPPVWDMWDKTCLALQIQMAASGQKSQTFPMTQNVSYRREMQST